MICSDLFTLLNSSTRKYLYLMYTLFLQLLNSQEDMLYNGHFSEGGMSSMLLEGCCATKIRCSLSNISAIL